MIKTKSLFSYLKKKNINFFTGVPDSILKESKYILDKLELKNHIVAHNEGGAIGIGAGYYLKTKKIACVYFQNSGLGNAVNPLVSMAHKNVYSIPMLLLIGWRGAPNISKDEPQHLLQGKITEKLLKLMNIKYCIIDHPKDFMKLGKIIEISKKKQMPVACLIKKNTLKSFDKIKKKKKDKIKLKRHEIISFIIKKNQKNIKIFSTTGYTSRELYQLRKLNKSNVKDFLNVGAMGHTSMIALGYSLKNKKKKTLCLDGDGSLIMHMGTLPVIGENSAKNFKHVVFNNEEHESVGGQKTPQKNVNFKRLSLSCGYKKYFFSNTLNDFKKKYSFFLKSSGPSFYEIKISPGSLKDLERPNNFIKIKKSF